MLNLGCKGAWILDLAKEVPSTIELHGVDVSANNFPKPSAIPGNAQFTATSSTQLPQSWTNKFSFANQRFLCGALRRTEWPVVMSELFRVLQPGGKIQIIDLDVPYPPERSSTPAINRMRVAGRDLYDRHGLMYECGQRLAEMLDTAGFVHIKADSKYLPMGRKWGEVGRMGSYSLGTALQNMRGPMMNGDYFRSEKEYDDLVDAIKMEWDEVGVQYLARVVCAQKPAGIAARYSS